jgi:D-alanyl-D-alanine dipeptidase
MSTPPAGFVDLQQAVPGLREQINYHTAHNFTGAPLPGYGAAAAWLLQEPAEHLARVQAALAKRGLSLLVYDAYRPLRATLGMVAWAEREDKVDLLDHGYVARRSGHNHGHTIDLTVVDAETGEPLDMGTPWDTLDERSHTFRASGQALKNRLLLKAAMEAEGFKAYLKEWWHFSYPLEGTRSRDVPYGCFEPREGQWTAPSGWDKKGFVMPAVIEARPCR